MSSTRNAEHKGNSRGFSFRNNYFLKAFFLGLGLSFLVFLPYAIRDGGRFLFYGDFNVQQVPFYRLAHDAVVSGNLGWSHLTDLGANFIGSYSFYLLGSPFFWLTIPFPGEWLQYMMGPLLVLKFACASLTGYIYLRRYVKNQDYALIGAILYAFSGFSVYNIFFNHFHEAIVFFPLLLAALDEYMCHRRRGLFALAVLFCCLVNYYFFVGQVTFTLIYFFLRLGCGSWRISLRDFLLLALEAVLGLGMSFFLLLPSILTIIQNPRVNNPINGWSALLYDRNQRYVHILQCLFFPPDLPARPNFTPESGSKWSSLGAWLPLFGMTGVIGWLQLRRKHWLKKLLWILFAMAVIPVLNSSFQLLNSSFYARWLYMLTLVMALATVMSLEEQRTDWRRAVKWSFTITLLITLAIGLMPEEIKEDGTSRVEFGLEQYPTRFWSYAAISMICLALLVFLFHFCRNPKPGESGEEAAEVSEKKFTRSVLVTLCCVAVLYSTFFIGLGKTQSADPYDHLIPYGLNGGKNLPPLELDTVRSDFYESLDNSAMFWEIPSIQTFHSIVPGSVMEFYTTIGVTRDVASRPDTSHYGLRALTSTKWLFDDEDDDAYFGDEDFVSPKMPGWIYYGTANGFDIWENQLCPPMGFSYDSYLTRTELEQIPEEKRELVMLKALVLEDQDAAKWSDLLPHYETSPIIYTDAEFEKDCLARAENACSSFQYTNYGFEASLSTDKERVIFFSVPYEAGWSAAVNGERAEILRANVGFMAVRVPAGEAVRITFTFTTPGLAIGILISVLSLIALIAYLILMKVYGKKERMRIRRERMRVARKLSFYAKEVNASFTLRTPEGFLREATPHVPEEPVELTGPWMSDEAIAEVVADLAAEANGKPEEKPEEEKPGKPPEDPSDKTEEGGGAGDA